MPRPDIHYLTVGPFASNCYLVGCPETRDAIVIDPGGDAGSITALIARTGLKVLYIVNTHGHIDHIAANAAVKRSTGAELLIHEDDAPMLTNAAKNLSLLSAFPVRQLPADRTLRDGDVVEFGRFSARVAHTPGHTPGGVCLLVDDVAFTGDTLFAGSVGRTDFPGGSMSALVRSIREKLLVLPDETVLYPGHGPETTVGLERAQNPFIQG